MPLFYTRSRDGLPRGWLRMMKRSISTLCPVFNTSRMVQEYMETCYWPSAQRFLRLTADNLKKATDAGAAGGGGWRAAGGRYASRRVEANGADPMHVGGELEVKARVNLGSFSPDDVEVQLFHGLVDSLGEIPQPRHGDDEPQRHAEAGQHLGVPAARSRAARAASTASRCACCRSNGDLANPFEPGLVCWD